MKDPKEMFKENMITDGDTPAEREKEEKMSLGDLFVNRSTRKGGYSVGLSIVVIAIAVVLSLMVGLLPENLTKLDLSDTRIYEIGDTTKSVISSLDKNIEITVISDIDRMDSRIKRICDKYDGMSKNISVSYVDPVQTPSILDLAKTDQVYVYCPQTQKSKTIDFTDIIQYDIYTYYQTGQYEETVFDGEGQLTGAIVNVTNEAPTNIYMLRGHGEKDIGEKLSDLIDKQNILVQDVNLMTGGRIDPSEGEVLIINGPIMDITEAEKDTLLDYLDNGGTIFYFAAYQGNEFTLTNLNYLLHVYGIEQMHGFIQDQDSQHCIPNSPTYILPDIQFFLNITDDAYSRRLSVLLADPSNQDFVVGFREVDAIKSGAQVIPMLQTSEKGLLTYVDDEGNVVQEEGLYVVGYLTRKTDHGTIFAFSDLLIDDFVLTQYESVVVNATIVMNAVAYSIKGMENVSIPGKSLQMTYNTIANGFVLGGAYMILLPVTVMIIGLIIWIRRRRA